MASPPYDQGRALLGAVPKYLCKVVFIVWFKILIDFMPITNGFYPFLGDIGHFWKETCL
jgi:hypothetical protein